MLYNNAMAARACGITVTAPPRTAAAADQFQFYDGNGYIVITPNTRPPDSAAWQNDPEFCAGFHENGDQLFTRYNGGLVQADKVGGQ